MDDGAEEFSSAMRSFVFYGLVALSQAVHPLHNDHAIVQQANHVSDGVSSTTVRCNIYMLVLELWRSFGTDWLMMSSSLSLHRSTATSPAFDWWWFRADDEKKHEEQQHGLGPMWPLCTLISLAAGDFRLGLGRWATAVENGKDPSKDCEGLSSEIDCCARIVTEAVWLMTTIAEDEDAMSIWSPDAILHVRKSLEDALNSSIQYFNALSEDMQAFSTLEIASKSDGPAQPSSCNRVLSEEEEEVGRSCCLVMGSIAAELEVDHLLAKPSTGTSHSDASRNELEASYFAPALRSAILFCHSLGERQLHNCNFNSSSHMRKMRHEYQEPLTHLLPCVMSLLSNVMTSDQNKRNSSEEEELHLALTTLCKDGSLILALTRFLHRGSKQWRNCFEGDENVSQFDNLTIHRIDSMTSTCEMCALIIKDIMVSGASSPNRNIFSNQLRHELLLVLELWETNIAYVDEWPSKKLSRNAKVALNQTTHCLLAFEPQGIPR